MHPPVAVGRQVGDQCTDIGHEFGIGQWRPPARPGRWPVAHRGQVRPCDADRFGDRAHRPSSGNEIERNGSFFGPAARETASRRISFSIVFLPSMRCSSRTWASRAR